MTRLLLNDVFGQSIAAFTSKNDTGKTALVVAWFCRHGFKQPRKATAEAVGVSEQVVKNVVHSYRGEIEALLNDAFELGYKPEQIASMIAHPTLESTVRTFTTRLRDLRAKRSEKGTLGVLGPAWEDFVQQAWFEVRLNHAYHGGAADDIELRPTLEFRKELAELLK